MAEYRYIFADLLTNEVSLELPLQGVSFSRMLNKAGNCNFSFGLNREGFDNTDTLDGTIPGKTALYIEREGNLVWGGVVWSRTWQEQALSLQYTAQSFESFLLAADIRASTTFTGVDQRQILVSLIDNMQLNYFWDIDIILPSGLPDPSNPNIILPPFPSTSPGAVLRTVNFFDYEEWTYGKAAEYLVEYADGFDYTIDVRYGETGDFEKVLVIDNELGAPVEVTQLSWDYPGSIKNYWLPENASKGAVTVKGIGAGDGSAMTRAIATNSALLSLGYPELTRFYTNKDVSVQETMDSKVQSELRRLAVPVSVPTFEINPEEEPTFGSWQIGDYAKIQVESPRFPDGKEFITRIVGYDATPSSSTSQEQLKLIVVGEDEVGG